MKELHIKTIFLLLLCLFLLPNLSQAQSWTGASGKLYANPTSTSVGIGTSNPYSSYKLTINGGSTKYGLYVYSGKNYAGYFSGNIGVTGDIKANETSGSFNIYTNYSDSNGPYFRLYGKNNSSRPGGMSIVAYQQGTIEFFSRTSSSWAKHMVINPTGKITIGTTANPNVVGGANISGYKLFVKGGILTEELRVRTGWADYVFDENYKLTPLQDVATHIATKGHLHNTPSAKQVEAEGIEIGEMTKNQQEKIEEVFLHLIAMEKDIQRLSTLENRIDQLEKENSSLKKALNAKE